MPCRKQRALSRQSANNENDRRCASFQCRTQIVSTKTYAASHRWPALGDYARLEMESLHDDSGFGIKIRPNLTPDICANPCQKFPPRAAAVLTSLALFAESPTIAISLAPARGFTLIQSV